VTCPENYKNVGYFTCFQERFFGESVCVAVGQNVKVQVVTKVAGSMEVELDLPANTTQQEVEDMFKKAIVESLGISLNDVVKLVVVAVEPGSDSERRLQASESKQYLVSYEVLPPSSLDPAEVVSRANRIAESSSSEAQVFQQVLSTGYGQKFVR